MDKFIIASMVKDNNKIEQRRKQILEASIVPFKEKGFHQTTTREIARNADMSFGAIYEYIDRKEDILYLFYEALYDQLNEMLNEKICDENKGILRLKSFIKEYFTIIDEISDETSIMYSESRSLSKSYLQYVFSKESEFINYVKSILSQSLLEENIEIVEKKICILSHNIIVQGHMWAFRGWALKKSFDLSEYIDLQMNLLIDSISELREKSPHSKVDYSDMD